MCSYNMVNGSFACENKEVLVDLLKEEVSCASPAGPGAFADRFPSLACIPRFRAYSELAQDYVLRLARIAAAVDGEAAAH